MKRKLDPALYQVNLPVPKWPRADKPELWSQHDEDSAMMVNALSLDGPKASPNPLVYYVNHNDQFIKLSLFFQALDLAMSGHQSFDDFDIVLDDDIEKVRRRQAQLAREADEAWWMAYIAQLRRRPTYSDKAES